MKDLGRGNQNLIDLWRGVVLSFRLKPQLTRSFTILYLKKKNC